MLAHYVLARRIMARLLVLVLATLGAAAAKDDPLRSALMMQTKEKLFEIAQKAGIHGYDEDTDIDTMRKLVYEHAQHEKPCWTARAVENRGSSSGVSPMRETTSREHCA